MNKTLPQPICAMSRDHAQFHEFHVSFGFSGIQKPGFLTIWLCASGDADAADIPPFRKKCRKALEECHILQRSWNVYGVIPEL